MEAGINPEHLFQVGQRFLKLPGKNVRPTLDRGHDERERVELLGAVEQLMRPVEKPDHGQVGAEPIGRARRVGIELERPLIFRDRLLPFESKLPVDEREQAMRLR